MSVDKTYIQLFSDLKVKIQLAQQRAALAVNTEMLELYWYIGKVLSRQIKSAGWGAKVIDRLSADLKSEFPNIKGFSVRNLKYMRTFAETYPDFVQGGFEQLEELVLQPPVAKTQLAEKQTKEFVQPPVAQIPWSHHTVILDRVKHADDRLFYLQKTAENGWSKDVLVLQIESKLHKRQGQAITNFERTLPRPQSDLAKETLKSSYLFDFLGIG